MIPVDLTSKLIGRIVVLEFEDYEGNNYVTGNTIETATGTLEYFSFHPNGNASVLFKGMSAPMVYSEKKVNAKFFVSRNL